jgi:Raf kinase inhibitor-like YbhB/YbcL family protein
VATAVAVALLLVGCAHDGRTLRAPPAGASAPPLPATTAPSQGGTVAAPLTFTSTAFEPGGPIPIEFTCDGANTSPPLAWGSVPEGTAELAITVTDTDANGFVHWVLVGLDRTVQALPAGAAPEGATQAKNDAGTVGWSGPCPPKGSGPHHYVFTLYALTARSGVSAEMKGKEAVTAISKVSGITATLLGSYQRA